MAKSILTKTIVFVIRNFPLLTGFVAYLKSGFFNFLFLPHKAHIYGPKQRGDSGFILKGMKKLLHNPCIHGNESQGLKLFLKKGQSGH